MDLNRQRLLGIVKNRVLCGPRFVSLCMNNYCNNQCLFCNTNSPLVDRSGTKSSDLAFGLAKKTIDQAAAWGSREVLMTGMGEPTLHPDFVKIAAYIKKKGLVSTLTTNALFDKKLFPAVAAVDNVLVNLSAPDERLYARLQSPGDKKAFMRALVNIYALLKLKRPGSPPNVILAFIINSLNYKSVGRMLALAEKLGVDNILFRFVEHKKETEEMLLSARQEKELLAIVGRAIKTSRGIRHNLDSIRSTLLDFDGFYNIDRCYAGWFVAEVGFTGTARICNEKMVVGDLKKDTLENIWRSPEAQKMRLRLKNNFKKEKAYWGPGCRLCCWHDLNAAIEGALERGWKSGLDQTFPEDLPVKSNP